MIAPPDVVTGPVGSVDQNGGLSDRQSRTLIGFPSVSR